MVGTLLGSLSWTGHYAIQVKFWSTNILSLDKLDSVGRTNHALCLYNCAKTHQILWNFIGRLGSSLLNKHEGSLTIKLEIMFCNNSALFLPE